MDVQQLVSMANQIRDFFESSATRAEGVAAIAQHLENFWHPRMRRAIIAHVKETGGPDLKDMVREAVLMLDVKPATQAPS